MALDLAGLVVDTTSTSGTGTYTLDGPASPGGGLRTLANAVADGHVTAGNTVFYWVVDKTTEGAALEFEHGIGTVGAGGASLARTEIIESSNGDLAVSWPGGGSRTVRFGVPTSAMLFGVNNLSDVDDADTAADNIGAARLNAQNSFDLRQLIQASDAAIFNALEVRNLTNPGTAASGASVGWVQRNAAGTLRVAFEVESTLSDVTNGSEDSDIRFQGYIGGVSQNLFRWVNGALQSGAGNNYDAFPSGMDFLSGTVPTGWTRQNETQSRLIRMAKSGDTLGATGGSDDVFDGAWATAGYTLSITEIPNHDHTVQYGVNTNVQGGGVAVVIATLGSGGSNASTSTTGGGGSHAHNLTTPYYRIWARITKD